MNASSLTSALQKIRELLTREDKFTIIGIAGFALLTSLFEVVTASVIVIFAQVLNQPELGQTYLSKIGYTEALSPGRTVFYLAFIVGGFYIIKNIVAAGELFFQNIALQKMNYRFKQRMLQRYAQADYGFYLTRNSHQGYNVISSDINMMFSSGMVALAIILSESTVLIFMVGLMIMMNPSLFIIIGGLVLAVGGLMKWLMPFFYQFGQRLQHSNLMAGQHLLQFFHAYKEVVLLGKRDYFINSFAKFSRIMARTTALQTAMSQMPRFFIETLFVGIFVLTIAVLCLENETPSAMLGLLGGYLYAGFRLMPGLNRMVQQLNIIKTMVPYIERIYEEYNHDASKENYVNAPQLTFTESLQFKGVSFKYLNTKNDALSNVDLTIQKGECLGIVGETGSGKSTLVDIILGLLKPYKGSVLIDDKFPVNSTQWHGKIGYVPQSIYLIDDTVAANIAFGEEEIDEQRLNRAIDSAQLRKFINHLPDGPQTVVGERGVRLSGGERQRIAIARALYRNPEVLIFDEATSALDNETEAKLMETIHTVSQDRTVIMIAHRLSTLDRCNRVIKVEGGRVC